MEELGEAAPRYHRELGRSLRLRPQDRVITIGGNAGEVVQGGLEAGCVSSQLEIAVDLSSITARIAAFSGSVFVKGSRRYELEHALPAGVVPSSDHA